MAAGSRLDGPGRIKMAALEEARDHLGKLHSLIEKYAMEAARKGGTHSLLMQIKRTLPNLAGTLQGHFGALSDQVAALHRTATGGGSEQTRVRGLREGIALLRTAFDIAEHQLFEKHAVKLDTPAADEASGAGRATQG